LFRYFLDISYKGTNYHGWQRQPNANSIQAEVENALGLMFQLKIGIMGSGRTDTGVHAQQQIAHFDSETELDISDISHKINRILPNDIVVNEVKAVQKTAHARFDATLRSYEYHLHQKRNPFKVGFSYFYAKQLDLEKMNAAAKKLLGEQDFQSFSKVKTEVNNFICKIKSAEWKIDNDSLVFCVTANRFLRGMIRALVGTLTEVGLGNMSLDDFQKVIDVKDRTKAGRAVPPEGLFLTVVQYPVELYI
jgi:tRNA pseudouridine38-40 synthase